METGEAGACQGSVADCLGWGDMGEKTWAYFSFLARAAGRWR